MAYKSLKLLFSRQKLFKDTLIQKNVFTLPPQISATKIVKSTKMKKKGININDLFLHFCLIYEIICIFAAVKSTYKLL